MNYLDNYDMQIMRQIGSLLDIDGNTDVTISSLSPDYIQTLVTTKS